GGGSDIPTPEPGVQIPDPASEMDNPIGPFVFEFTMPYIPQIELQPTQTVEAAGINMRLENLSITPSMTTAHFCYDYSEDRQVYPDESSVTMNETTVQASMGGQASIPEDDATQVCYDFGYYAPYELQPTTLTLTIPRLASAPQYTSERVAEFIRTL